MTYDLRTALVFNGFAVWALIAMLIIMFMVCRGKEIPQISIVYGMTAVALVVVMIGCARGEIFSQVHDLQVEQYKLVYLVEHLKEASLGKPDEEPWEIEPDVRLFEVDSRIQEEAMQEVSLLCLNTLDAWDLKYPIAKYNSDIASFLETNSRWPISNFYLRVSNVDKLKPIDWESIPKERRFVLRESSIERLSQQWGIPEEEIRLELDEVANSSTKSLAGAARSNLEFSAGDSEIAGNLEQGNVDSEASIAERKSKAFEDALITGVGCFIVFLWMSLMHFKEWLPAFLGSSISGLIVFIVSYIAYLFDLLV